MLTKLFRKLLGIPKPTSSIWEAKFIPLAIYNGEKMRGLVHTEKYTQEMGELQKEYDLKWSVVNRQSAGFPVVIPGTKTEGARG